MKIVVAGGSGFIGSKLIQRLTEDKNEIVLLTRRQKIISRTQNDLIKTVQWDGKTLGNWVEYVDGSDVVINLSGENIANKRWSKEQKLKLFQSRTEPTKAIINAIANAKQKPKLLINASASGYYGYDSKDIITESYSKGTGFLAELCLSWEQAALEAEKNNVRVILIRTGIVLDPNQGALKKMILPYKFFVGGPLGSGKQWFPWIHIDDVINIIIFVLKNDKLSGAINVSSPQPITMREFSKKLGKAIRRPSWISVPSFALKILLGEMSAMLIGGLQMIPKKLIDNGFVFKYSNIDDALNNLLRK